MSRAAGDVAARLYPETSVGGFSRVDGTVAFYERVNALLRPDSVVLDHGAGRAEWLDELDVAGGLPWPQHLRLLRGRAGRVIGVDVDEAVLGNVALDEAHVLAPGGVLPLADGSVDLVVSDHVFEHVADPAAIARELDRVLRPGGWVCARTPNLHGYISLASRLVPDALHDAVLRRAQPDRQEQDVFPTHYRLNTRADIARAFAPDRFELVVWTINPEPAYFGRSVVAIRAAQGVSRLLPPALGAVLLVFLRKR